MFAYMRKMVVLLLMVVEVVMMVAEAEKPG